MEVFGLGLGITLALVGIYLWYMRRQDGAVRIVGASCFFVAAYFLDRLCSLVIEGIVQGDSWGQMRFVGLALSKSMAGILLFVICGIGRKDPENRKDGDREMADANAQGGPRMTYVEKLTVAGSFFFWCVLMASGEILGRGMRIAGEDGPRQDGDVKVDLAWTVLLFVTWLAFGFSAYRHGYKERGRQAERSRQQEHRQTELYLYTIESNYQRTRELWHDLRNHISLLDLLLQEGKYEQMRDYLRIFGEEIDRIALPAKSGNLIVDAVLADKAARAKREKIAVEVDLCDLTELFLKPDEICSLFGNLLDNAIEACLRVDGERKITITCRVRGEETFFSVRNTMAEEKPGQGKLLASPKKDRENVVGHGLGLRSVERIVNRYAGELVTDAVGGIFTVAVRLPGADRADRIEEGMKEEMAGGETELPMPLSEEW